MHLAQWVTMDLARPSGSCQKWVNMDLAHLGGVQRGHRVEIWAPRWYNQVVAQGGGGDQCARTKMQYNNV